MDLGVAIHTDEGSPQAQSALVALARTLNINENALNAVLNGAFDLLPTAAGIPILALHLSFILLSYHIDAETLYEALGAFRQAFGATLSTERVNYATAQAVSRQYHEAHRAPPSYAQPSHNMCMGSSEYPILAFRSPKELNHHRNIQVGLPPWYLGYTGNASSSRSQPAATAADQKAPALRDYPRPGTSSRGNESPSSPPGFAGFQ